MFTVIDSGGPTPAPPVVTLTGADSASFKIASNTCTAALKHIDNCTVGVVFSPPATGVAGVRQAQLSVASLDTNTLVGLKGSVMSGVTVSIKGAGTGRVVSTPNAIDCPVACQTLFAAPTITLTVTPDADSTLASVTACTGSPTACQVALDGPMKLVTVTFDKK
jgi:hypothetical protein